MKKYNPEEYEPVQDRIPKFFAKYKDGRIIPEVVSSTEESVIVKATLFKSFEEQKENCPISVGIAHEFRDKELKKNRYGKDYESVNYSCWVENCSTSAIGRALANIGIHGNKRASREEMEKVGRHQAKGNRLNSQENKKGEQLSPIDQKFLDEPVSAESWKQLDEHIGLNDHNVNMYLRDKDIITDDQTYKDLEKVGKDVLLRMFKNTSNFLKAVNEWCNQKDLDFINKVEGK